MNIINKKNIEVKENKELSSKFLTAANGELNFDCKILKEDFFLDSHNYFPITANYNTFDELFSWGDNLKYKKFDTKIFFEDFKKNEISFKTFSNIFVLGSSSVDNYYRNMITFFPRIFFANEKKIKLGIHRNLSNKFKNFILSVCQKLNIEVQWIFLDDGFYKFIDSQIPEFLSKNYSIKILNNLINLKKNQATKENDEKIYITRYNTIYRNLINETDVADLLKKNGFKLFNLNNLDIFQQIELFSKAKVIVGVTGSGLTNTVFCRPGTKVIEIMPNYQYSYENHLKLRYQYISNELNLDYIKVEADPVELEIDIKNNKVSNFISSNVLNESNYYKNLLIKIDKLKQIL